MCRFFESLPVWMIVGMVIFSASCSSTDASDDDFVKEVPDHTIFIASTLEATSDTAQHYPEVYVGSVTHKKDFYRRKPWVETIPGIWWPILNAQVNKTTQRTDLVRQDINNAVVEITGPIGLARQQTVKFTSEGLGDYGDRQYKLKLLPGNAYRLDVKLHDGRHYRSTTTIPAMPEWQTPDSLQVQLELHDYGDGSYLEQNVSEKHIKLPYTPTAWMTTGKINYKGETETLQSIGQHGVEYGDRGPFLREGGNYMIQTNTSFPNRNYYGPVWLEGSNKPIKDHLLAYMRLSQLNKDLSKQWYYQNIFMFIGTGSGDFWEKKDSTFVAAYFGNERTSTFLFDNSNILKVGKNGKVLPEKQTDAIGVFGGLSTVYRTMTMIPIRSWDPDTLNWGQK